MPKTMFEKIWEAHSVGVEDSGCSTSICTSSTR